uniref:Uncharacterized protein n=1 Tax=Tanacetum cinerariifolium TaxID=118510 RepID=A0A6L2NRC2_TANCI|nr:hypothetical protein [Tanacetum cinerariifolium]
MGVEISCDFKYASFKILGGSVNRRDLPRDIPIVSVEVLRYDENKSKSELKRRVPTEMELVREQTHKVLVIESWPKVTSSQDGKVYKMAKRDYAWLMLSSIVETDTMIHTVETDIVKLVVEIKSFGMGFDEFDKETVSVDWLQQKLADLSYVHALNELHLHKIRVVPSKHEADQCGRLSALERIALSARVVIDKFFKRRAYVNFVPLGLIRTRSAPKPLLLDTPSIKRVQVFVTSSSTFATGASDGNPPVLNLLVYYDFDQMGFERSTNIMDWHCFCFLFVRRIVLTPLCVTARPMVPGLAGVSGGRIVGVVGSGGMAEKNVGSGVAGWREIGMNRVCLNVGGRWGYSLGIFTQLVPGLVKD